MTARLYRRRRVAVAGVGLVAFGVQAVYAVAAAPNLLPVSDANGYRLLGQHLADGYGYIRPYDFALGGVVRPTAEFPPGFPALLGALDVLGIESVRGQRLALAALGALTAMVVVLIARRWFSDRGAVALGLVAAIHPALFQPGAALLAESLYVFAVVVVMLAALRLREEPTAWRGLQLGLAGGAAALVRSEALLLAVLLAVPLLVAAGGRRVRVPAAVGLLVGAVLLPGAWAVRNLQTFDEPVLVSNNLGSVLSGSYCDETFSGELVGYWRISPECFAGFHDEDLQVVDESVVAGRLRDDGLSYARHHLGQLPRVATARVLRTFQLFRPEQQARLATFEGRKLLTERITGWITWATLLLAAPGAVALWRRRRWYELWFLTAPVLVVVAVSAATYGNPRFRIGADVALVLLAAEAIRTGWTRWRDGPSDDEGEAQPAWQWDGGVIPGSADAPPTG